MKREINDWVFFEEKNTFINKKKGVALRTGHDFEIAFFFRKGAPPNIIKIERGVIVDYFINSMKKIVSHRDKELDFFLYQFEGDTCSSEGKTNVT